MKKPIPKILPAWISALACAGAFALQAAPVRAASAVLEEVIVEAQKKVETITETPVAISALSGEQFQKMASFNFQDISRSVPGLSFDPGVTPDIHLRGISTVTLAGVSLRTNIYQDGALIEQPRALFDAQFDIERFEVLKGAQGTLYGKSSPTGTINIRTANPNLNKVDGYISTSLGEYDAFNTQFGVSIPIIEGQLAVRLAGVYDENRASDQKNITLGKNAQSRNSGARVTVLWQPDDAFSARLSYHYREKRDNPWYTIDGDGLRFDQDRTLSNISDYNQVRDQLGVLEINWALDDHLTLTSVTAYEDQEYRNLQDTDGSSSTASAAYGLPTGDQQFTHIPLRPQIQQDLRLASEDNPFWDWQIGAYYHRESTQTVVQRSQLAPMLGWFFPVDLTTTAVLSAEEYALYTHNTFKLTDALNLIVGLRYQQARYNSTQPTEGYVYLDGEPLPLVPTFLPGNGIPDELRNQTYYPLTGTAKLQYFFTPDLMAYFSYDHSYRTGAANLNIQGNTPRDFASIAPEFANSFELGVKGTFGNQRGRFALTLFDQIYKNFQQDLQNIWVWDTTAGYPRPSALQNLVVNAKEAQTRGAELQLTWLLLDNWDVDLSLAYTDSKYKDFGNAPCSPVPIPTEENPGPLSSDTPYVTCNLSGARLPQAPRWSGVVSSSFSLPLRGFAEWYVRGLTNFNSSQIDKVTRRELGGYITADFFTGLRQDNDNGGWDVSLWVKNAFDRRVITRIYNSQVEDMASGERFDMVNTNLPRQVGLTGTWRFK